MPSGIRTRIAVSPRKRPLIWSMVVPGSTIGKGGSITSRTTREPRFSPLQHEGDQAILSHSAQKLSVLEHGELGNISLVHVLEGILRAVRGGRRLQRGHAGLVSQALARREPDRRLEVAVLPHPLIVEHLAHILAARVRDEHDDVVVRGQRPARAGVLPRRHRLKNPQRRCLRAGPACAP